MRILAVGGGSGGHVTPVVAVIREIKELRPRADVRFWCDKKFASQAKEIIRNYDETIPVQLIYAGKFRRYHHLSAVRQILWPSLVLKNIGDMFLVIIGFFQSFFKLLIWRPNVVFVKGGFVCLPVGFAARILRIPLVIHDSDAHPGLTNRLLSRWASDIATGAPLEFYNYPANKSRYVGIPINSEFKKFSHESITKARVEWGIESQMPLLVVTGGGLGASRINDAVVDKLDELLKICSVVLIAGEAQYEELKSKVRSNNDHFKLFSFISQGMPSLLGAADIVITRAGATSILELAALQKPTILVPNAKLTGGHQIKNAEVYQKAKAVEIINEDEMVENPQIIVDTVKQLLADTERMGDMARRLATFAKPNAAKDVAQMVIENAKQT